MDNLSAIQGLKPVKLWHHFAKISEIPRGSKNETQVMDYIKDFAREQNLRYKEDEAGNVVIYKDATKGFEHIPGIVLQGHTDMVCEKNRETEHDFEKDPIKLVRDGKFITADGTTLGADNGIGVCAALAVLEDDQIEHGPVEALFTIDEETGLTGAFSLDSGLLNHRKMLNLDSEEDGAVYVGCAGGKDTGGIFELQKEPVPASAVTYYLEVSGLKGGHSGLDINNGLANAIRLLSRVLIDIKGSHRFNLCSIEGGSKRNAIPREAFATFVFDNDDEKFLMDKISFWKNTFREEFGQIEPKLDIILEKRENPDFQFSSVLTDKLINTIFVLPHGVIAMSQSIPGLVETSTNLATISMNGEHIIIGTSQRSSIASSIEDISLRVKHLFEFSGAQVNDGDAYPGWKPNMDSKLLQTAARSMHKISGEKPEIKAIHAGLECGIIGEKFPGMDMVSFGPTIFGAHSPDEKVEIEAVEKFWDYLQDMLKNID